MDESINRKNYFLTNALGLLSFKKIILSIIIISFLSFTGEFFEDFRIYITLFSSAYLFYIFLKEFGFQYKKFPKLPKEILSFITLLIFTLFISTAFSQNINISLIAFLRMILFLLIIYIFYSFLNYEENIKVYIGSLLVVVIIIGIPMLIDLYNLGLKNYFIRILLTDKFDLVTSRGYTKLTILFISISLVSSMFFMSGFNKLSYKLGLIALLFFNIVILILANSRGGIVAGIISISFSLFILMRSMFIKSFLGVFGLFVLLIIVIPEVNEAVDLYLRWETVSDREVYWQMGLDVINDHPIVGIGPDMFDKVFFNYAPSKTVNYFRSDFLQIGKPHPHNFFFYFMAENGILGLISSVTFFILFFYFALKTIRLTQNINRDYYILSVAITGIGIGLFFRSFIEVSGYLLYGYITADLPFWLMFAVLISIHQKYLMIHKSKLTNKSLI